MLHYLRTTCAIAMVGITAPMAMAETPADTLVIVREISSISDWDPAVSQILDVQEINLDIYDRLVGFDRRTGGDVIPMLAESYEVAEDGSAITFKIRDGVTFHSGNPVTSEDVVYSFRRLLLLGREPSSNMVQLGYTAENIDGNLSAPDEQTFVMKLPERLAPSLVINMLTSAPVNGGVKTGHVAAQNQASGGAPSAMARALAI